MRGLIFKQCDYSVILCFIVPLTSFAYKCNMHIDAFVKHVLFL